MSSPGDALAQLQAKDKQIAALKAEIERGGSLLAEAATAIDRAEKAEARVSMRAESDEPISESAWAIRNLFCFITSTVRPTRTSAWDAWAGDDSDGHRAKRIRYWKRRGYRAVQVNLVEVP